MRGAIVPRTKKWEAVHRSIMPKMKKLTAAKEDGIITETAQENTGGA